MHAASLIAAFIIGTIFASFLALAWAGPTSAPPNGNVSAPLNVPTTDKIKNTGPSLEASFGQSGHATYSQRDGARHDRR